MPFELPAEAVRDALVKTASSQGVPDVVAVCLGQTALHLENRGAPGVERVLGYLEMIRDRFDPKHEYESFGAPTIAAASAHHQVEGVCPMSMVSAIGTLYSEAVLKPGQFLLLKGPTDPLLMAPLLYYRIKDYNKAVSMISSRQLIYTNAGIRFLTDDAPNDRSDFSQFSRIDLEDLPMVMVSIISEPWKGDNRLTLPFIRKTHLTVKEAPTAEGVFPLR